MMMDMDAAGSIEVRSRSARHASPLWIALGSVAAVRFCLSGREASRIATRCVQGRRFGLSGRGDRLPAVLLTSVVCSRGAQAFHRSNASLRTGYTHLFDGVSGGIDRRAAADFRERCRLGLHMGQTAGFAPGFVQANFVMLPQAAAFDFLLFALRNPQACPLLAVTAPGDPCAHNVAPGSNVCTDIPKYRVWRHGELADEVQGRGAGRLRGCGAGRQRSTAAAAPGLGLVASRRPRPSIAC
jgi:hypothetical protein